MGSGNVLENQEIYCCYLTMNFGPIFYLAMTLLNLGLVMCPAHIQNVLYLAVKSVKRVPEQDQTDY